MSSNTNFVQLKLALAATAAQTTLTVMVPSAPFQLPAPNGTLTLLDVPAAPTKAEIVGYTTVTNNGDGTATLGGVTRGKEGTTAQAWAINAVLVQSLTAADYAADLAGKQATITGGASTIASANLTASRALVSDANGKVAVSAASSAELGYLSGVTSGVQAQLNAKQQQKEKLVGDSYVECLSIVGEGVYSSLTIYTNIPAVEGVMWTIKLEGAASGYTSPVSATIGGYFYAGAVYLPTMTVLASSAGAFTSATAGVVNGKIAIRLEGIGYIPRLNVSVLRKMGGTYSPSDAALQGWSHAFDTAALPSAVTVKTMRAPVLGANASLYNIPYTGAVGPYEYIALTYVGRELHFGLNQSAGWYLKPDIDGGMHLGTAAYRWATLFAVTGAINTSDARHKTAVQPLSTAELTVAKQLAGEIGTFQWLDAIAEKGAAARHHFGVTVQRVMEVFTAHGLDPFRYGVVCYDQWADEVKHRPEEVVPTQVPAVLDADGNVLEVEYIRYEVIPARDEVTREAGDLYSLRMDQLALFLARGQAQRQDELEARIAALEAQP